MHQYLLYVKQQHGKRGWQAYVTPCFEVDRLYWEERDGGSLHIVGRCRSLALAFALREEIGRLLALHSSSRAPIEQIRQRALRCVQELNRAYRQKGQLQAERFGGVEPSAADAMAEAPYAVDAPDVLAPTLPGAAAGVDSSGTPVPASLMSVSQQDQAASQTSRSAELVLSAGQIAAMAERLLPLLVGRALLAAEIEARLRVAGCAIPAPLMIPLQWLVLEGCALLLPAVGLEWRRSWWRNQLRFICQRCGADERDGAIRLTVCHTCRQGCAYCLCCLQMGRCKCCTPYVQVEQVENVQAEPFGAQVGTAQVAASLGPPVQSGSVRDGTTLERGMQRETARVRTAQSHAVPRDPAPSLLQWSGSYSPLQAQAAEQARRFAAAPPLPGSSRNATGASIPAFLIWAVCGAGKTELVFPAIEETLRSGGRVLIATPRKDVVLELAPRLRAVFPTAKVIAVYGGSDEKWEEAELTVSTTHQVLRFYRRFALVIVDEVDAFPYHGDPVLQRAVQRAVGRGGKLLYLTATPPSDLRDRLVHSGESAGSICPYLAPIGRLLRRSLAWRPVRLPLASPTHVLVPQRYHGHPLPVPRSVLISGLQRNLRLSRNIPLLIQTIKQSFDAGRQVFVFVARVSQTAQVLSYLRKLLPELADRMDAVSAADPEREEKVRRFRERTLRLLVTTTILERGVTIPRSDVIVLEADDPVFDEAALVQIAGRVGRSADDPGGTVLFLLTRRSRAPYTAVKQIRAMNRLAAEVSSADLSGTRLTPPRGNSVVQRDSRKRRVKRHDP
ncbi:DEAD/DEAH box helicase [Brevibacillus marinus]|uniref:DEAD/DEAH box helicase n=1 Tax=Brevibacillus marinus TaxID=2496837 RepID=UPI001F49CC3B|nr:helicase-related protein [Brevibacillus marinus]